MCWLCTYQGEPLGKKLNHFIVKHIGVMDITCISVQVSDYLHLHQRNNLEGASSEVIYEHIAKHMLHPRVRVAVLLRQLLEFSTILQSSLIVQDEGMCTVEKSNTELYLKVIGQIMQLYRSDPNGMLFADDNDATNGTDDGLSSNTAKASKV